MVAGTVEGRDTGGEARHFGAAYRGAEARLFCGLRWSAALPQLQAAHASVWCAGTIVPALRIKI
jgi:hypothetical protein